MREQIVDFLALHGARLGSAEALWAQVRDGASLLPEEPPRTVLDPETRAALKDRDAFSRLLTYVNSGAPLSSTERLQVGRLYRLQVAGQLDDESRRALDEGREAVTRTIRSFRTDVGTGTIGWEEMWSLFADCSDVGVRKEAWRRLMGLAERVTPALLDLVSLRNRVARGLGSADHLALSLTLRELDEFPVETILSEATQRTRPSFQSLRDEVQRNQSEVLKIKGSLPLPWLLEHPFRLLRPFEKQPVGPLRREALTATIAFLKHRGLPVSADRLRPELGKGPKPSPWVMALQVLRLLKRGAALLLEPETPTEKTPYPQTAHPSVLWATWLLLTEDFLRGPGLEELLHLPPKEAGCLRGQLRTALRQEKLICVHHAHAVLQFEQQLYGNPGRDLNGSIQTSLRENLGIEPADDAQKPVWAVIPSLLGPTGAYLERALGTILSEQIRRALPPVTRDQSLLDARESVEFLRRFVLDPATRQPVSEVVRRATGAPLGSRDFADTWNLES